MSTTCGTVSRQDAIEIIDPTPAYNGYWHSFTFKRLSAAVNSLTTGTEIAGLALPLKANTDYYFEYDLPYTTSSLLAGMEVALDFDAVGGAALVDFDARIVQATGANATFSETVGAVLTYMGGSAVGPGATARVARVTGTLVMGTVGGWLRLFTRASGLLGVSCTVQKGAHSRAIEVGTVPPQDA